MAWLLTCLCLFGGVYFYRHLPYNIWLGIYIVLGLVSSAIAVDSFLPLLLLLIPSLIVLLAVCFNVYDLIGKHQVNRINIASLLAFLLVAVMISFYLVDLKILGWFNLFLCLLIGYFLILFNAYFYTGLLTASHKQAIQVDAIVVLGAGLRGKQVPRVLAQRIKKGIQVLEDHPQALLLMSGGQGEGELVSEAQAMKDFAIDKGVDPQVIYLEDQSTSTYENLYFTKRMLKGEHRLAIVTSHYHLLRALLIAKDLGIECVGYGAPAGFFFSLRAFVREFAGYFYLKWRLHLVLMLGLSVFTYLFVVTFNR